LQFAILAGSTWSTERFRAQPGTLSELDPSSFEGLLGFELETDMLAGVEVTAKLSALPTIGSSGRYRVTFDNNTRVPLTGRFQWAVLVYDRFDSEPQPGVKRNDVGVVGALGFSF